MDIFKEALIGGMKLRNRIIRSATHERIEVPNDELKNIYIRLAKGGVGAIITGYAGVHRLGKATAKMPMFCSDEDHEGWRNLLKDVHQYETPVILQLSHGGGKSGLALIGRNGQSPSGYEYNKGQVSEAMSPEEIAEIIRSFAECIENAREAGFDGVQIQASHGYLLSEFLSPRLNRRTDEWGGSTAKRFRIVKEILEHARQRVGDDFPILVKLSAYDGDDGGMSLDESLVIAKLLEDASCDAIEVSCGNVNFFETVRTPKIPVDALLVSQPSYTKIPPEKIKLVAEEMAAKFKIAVPLEDYNVTAAEMIKSTVDIPVIVVGGIRNLKTIREIIETGKADFVALSRPFIIEPDIVDKLRSGRQENSRCINCSHCLVLRNGALKCYYGKTPEFIEGN